MNRLAKFDAYHEEAKLIVEAYKRQPDMTRIVEWLLTTDVCIEQHIGGYEQLFCIEQFCRLLYDVYRAITIQKRLGVLHINTVPTLELYSNAAEPCTVDEFIGKVEAFYKASTPTH